MKDNILSICLGNNKENLNGSKNDAILFLNYLIKLHNNKSLEENWLFPQILLDENVAEDNIIKIIKNTKKRINKVLIYYSGHGFKNGVLNIYKKNNKLMTDFDLINTVSNSVSNEIELNIILDSCYSGSFKTIPYNNVKKVSLLASCSHNQEASESLTSYNHIKEYFNLIKNVDNLTKIKDNMVIGVFTYNFISLLDGYSSLNEWKNVFLSSTWKEIELIANQKVIIIW